MSLKLRILVFCLLKYFTAKKSSKIKRILIVRPDAIGDFLYLIHHLNSLQVEPTTELYYLGNSQNQSLAKELLNPKIIFIGIDRAKLYSNFNYFKKMSAQLSEFGFAKIVYASVSRELYIDCLIFSLKSKMTLAFLGDLSLSKRVTRFITSLFYQQILPVGSAHEHVNLKNIFEHGFAENYRPQKFYFKGQLSPKVQALSNYVVMFPGASIKGKQWPMENFIEVSQLLENKYSIVWLGGHLEKSLIPQIKKHRPQDLILIGETNLMESFSIISYAKLLLSNDTSAVHMAEISNVETLCLLGGGHFNRFLPIPQDIPLKSNIKTMYFQLDCYGCNWQCPFVDGEKRSFPCIEKISVKQVRDEIISFCSVTT